MPSNCLFQDFFIINHSRLLETYAPRSDQPKLNRDSTELNDGERVVYGAFSNPEFVEKLVGFLSLEENKGQDKYSSKIMTIFKVG